MKRKIELFIKTLPLMTTSFIIGYEVRPGWLAVVGLVAALLTEADIEVKK